MTKNPKKAECRNAYKQLLGDVICWWSGGVTSAVACKIAIDIYGTERCKLIMIDTHNEDDDTYRFKADCENGTEKKLKLSHT